VRLWHAEPVTDAGTRVAQIADELRALAQNGLHYSTNDYDRERFHRTMELAAELLALVDPRDTVEIIEVFRGDLGLRTPAICGEAAIFDESGRLLLARRVGSGTWCLPGGAVEVGESPSASAVREAWEETGLRVRAKRLLAVFDNRTFGEETVARHAYFLIFECVVEGGDLTPSIETTEFRWVTVAEAAELELYRSHRLKVPEVFRLRSRAEAAFH
jgi:ADP-ribose pyrophosphatase YjhB (NUDIX family)